MNSKAPQSHPYFNDYFAINSTRNKSPISNKLDQNHPPVSFSQLARPTSRQGSIQKGLFQIEIEKSKNYQQKNQLDNPYHLLTVSTRAPTNKSPHKLLNLKSYGSLKTNSPLKSRPNHIISPQNHQNDRSSSRYKQFPISFSKLIKNQNYNSCKSTSNQCTKQNNKLLNNKPQTITKNSLKQSCKEASKQIMKEVLNHIQPSIKTSLKRQNSKCPTSSSITSHEEQDQVNVSVSDSIVYMNLDMNPYLI